MRNTENNMPCKLRFEIKSFVVFVLLFIIEVVIAKYVDDQIIRPYGGDVLVVILMYYFFKSFVDTRTIYLVIGVLLFAYLIEVGQYFKLVEILNLEHNKIMRIIIGSSFSWVDMIAYTIGGTICYLIDRNK